jgi:type VI secretion system secreted protein VgrG
VAAAKISAGYFQALTTGGAATAFATIKVVRCERFFTVIALRHTKCIKTDYHDAGPPTALLLTKVASTNEFCCRKIPAYSDILERYRLVRTMGSASTQPPNPLLLTTPFGKDKVVLQTFQADERISSLFHYSVEMISLDNALDFTKIVGKSITVTHTLQSGEKEYFNGIVGRFVQAGKHSRHTTYRADVHPWLWLLTMNSDCRIFQNKSVPDIIKSVFSDLSFTDFTDSTTRSYAQREYCVQYMESNFHFVTRLMEEEGIFYFFEHTATAHKLVLADDASAHKNIQGTSTVHMEPTARTWGDELEVFDCSWEQQVTVGEFKTDDYNFETPSTDLLAKASAKAKARSLYEYPGRYMVKGDGDALTSRMLAAFETPGKILRGSSSCRAFRAGAKFTLKAHSRADVNAGYYLRSLSLRADQTNMYNNSFEAIPDTVVFRPGRTAPRARIYGSQTATVVGKSGEEIWTDKYGRIKVKFHWDQAPAKDETASCWIRVAQGWAGKSWGNMFIPRIGMEVIVSFLEGDPDRPIVTGCVYNANQTVPYALPGEQTKSTIKSNSSKGGGGFNEFRFEDKKDSEEIFMQAQKDLNIKVLNDRTETITNNRTTTISKKNDTLTVSEGDRTIKVEKGKETHEVKDTRAVTVTGNETHTNKADFKQEVAGNFTLKVSGNISIEASGTVSIKSGTSFTNKAGTALTNEAGTDLTNKAGTSLTNKAGTTMENNAGISLTNKASASQTVDGGGMLSLKGGMVKIN